MIILSLLSLTSGFFSKEIFCGKDSNFFKQSIFIHEKNLVDSEHIPLILKCLPILVVFLGIFLGVHLKTITTFSNTEGYYK
jgi:hypothetical protein